MLLERLSQSLLTFTDPAVRTFVGGVRHDAHVDAVVVERVPLIDALVDAGVRRVDVVSRDEAGHFALVDVARRVDDDARAAPHRTVLQRNVYTASSVASGARNPSKYSVKLEN